MSSKYIFVIITFTFITLACSNTDTLQLENIDEVLIEENLTPEDIISNTDELLRDAERSELDFYSPMYYQKALSNLEQATIYLDEPPENIKNGVLMSAIAAQKFIEKAHKIKANVEANLSASLQHYQNLEKLDSPSLVPEDFNAITESLSELIHEIELGNTGTAVEMQRDLISDMAETEIKTLKLSYLEEASTYFTDAIEMDAEEFAAGSIESARLELEKSNKYIEKNFRNKLGVEKAGRDATRKARLAFHVNLEAKKLSEHTREETEQYVLDLYELSNDMHQRAYSQELNPEKLNELPEAMLQIFGALEQENTDLINAAKNRKIEARALEIEQQQEVESVALPEETSLFPVYETEELELNTDEQGFDSIESANE
jgi:hypothetical protein